MSRSVRYWLLSQSIKKQLEKYTRDVVKVWSGRWGLFSSEEWSVDIYSHVEFSMAEILKADYGINKDKQLFFYSYCSKNKHAITHELTKKSSPLSKSLLLDSVVEKALCELQMDYVSGNASADDIVDVTSIKSTDSINNNSMTKIELRNQQFQLTLFLSMTLIDLLVDDAPEEYSIQRQPLENALSAIDDEVVQLKIDYGQVNISIDELSSINVGDVICLDKSISSPMSIGDSKGNALLKGYLGLKDDDLALKITVKNN